jgi:hypothetical protein
MRAALQGLTAMAACALFAAAAAAQDLSDSCQMNGWSMGAEISAFKSTAENVVASAAETAAPPLEMSTLYVIKLRPQTGVQYPQASGKKSLVQNPLGGLVRFTVPANGQYRITVDSPLWIDVIGPAGMIAPTGYTGWHECRLFRKSVEYTLPAGAPLVLQISEATPELVRVVIEPAKH